MPAKTVRQAAEHPHGLGLGLNMHTSRPPVQNHPTLRAVPLAQGRAPETPKTNGSQSASAASSAAAAWSLPLDWCVQSHRVYSAPVPQPPFPDPITVRPWSYGIILGMSQRAMAYVHSRCSLRHPERLTACCWQPRAVAHVACQQGKCGISVPGDPLAFMPPLVAGRCDAVRRQGTLLNRVWFHVSAQWRTSMTPRRTREHRTSSLVEGL